MTTPLQRRICAAVVAVAVTAGSLAATGAAVADPADSFGSAAGGDIAAFGVCGLLGGFPILGRIGGCDKRPDQPGGQPKHPPSTPTKVPIRP